MRRVVVEITRTSLRALAVEGALAQPRIRAFVVEPLTGQPIDDTLRRALAGLQPARAHVISTFPREQVITRLLKLPATRQEELAQMVALVGKAQLPYPADQAVMDFHVVEQQAGTSLIQLVACHRDQLDRHLTLLRQAGLEPVLLTPSSWGILAWYQRLGRSPEIREPVAVIHVDADRTDLILLQQGCVVLSRSLSQGLRDWEIGEETLGQLAQELERSLSSLRNELPGVEAQSLIVTGLGPLDQWKGFFEQRLGKPVFVRSLQGDLRVPQPSARVGAMAPPASAAVVLGLAMAESHWLINLLPVEARQAQRHRRRMREFTWTGALLLVGLLIGAGLLSAHVRRQGRFNEATITALKHLETVTQQTARQEHDVALIEQLLESRRSTGKILTELFRLTSGDILFESLVFERPRGEVVIRGSAPATRQVLDYLRQLKASDQWDRVELRYSARRGISAGARTDFEIACHTKPHDQKTTALTP